MKFFVTMACVALFCNAAFSQGLVLTQFDKLITIDSPDGEWHDFKMGVRNGGTTTAPTRVSVDKSQMAPGHRVKFCFASECYDENTTMSSAKGGVSTLAPGAADTITFVGDFRADSNLTSSTAIFTFFNNSNPSDRVNVNMVLKVGNVQAVSDLDQSAAFSVSPVPAQDEVRFNLPNANNQSRSLRIIDVSGRELQSLVFDADRMVFSTQNLPNGVYAALVGAADGTFAQLRFVVQH